MKTSIRLKGERTFHEVTHNLLAAKPGDILTVKVSRLEDLLIEPGKLALTFNSDIALDPAEPGNIVNSYPVNNLAYNIISRKISSEIDMTIEDLECRSYTVLNYQCLGEAYLVSITDSKGNRYRLHVGEGALF